MKSEIQKLTSGQAVEAPGSDLRGQRTRKALIWTALVFFLLQLGFVVIVDCWFPLFYDSEAAARFKELRALAQAEPERPILLLLGSSRTCMSFRPEIVGDLLPGLGQHPLVYNYSHLGASPAFSLLQLQRLVRWGTRPRWVVVEIMPVWLSREATSLVAQVAVISELPFLLRHAAPKRILRDFVVPRIIPWYKNRAALLLALAPGLVDRTTAQAKHFEPLGPLGWDNRRWKHLQDPAVLGVPLEAARLDYAPGLQAFQVQERLTRPLDDLAVFCRREHIDLALVLSPESSTFRSWYGPTTETQIQNFCAQLSNRQGVPIVDCRDWLPDDAFFDGHHVLQHGADTFTRRFEQEVLRPLVRQGTIDTPSRSMMVAGR
jgi:hypothetical protein